MNPLVETPPKVRESSARRASGQRSTHDRARRFRPEIEGLRAIAVLLVAFFHAGIPGITGGFVGVDVFFVVSGFLITGLLADELRRTATIDLAGFWLRRGRRLLPALTLVTLATLGLAATIGSELELVGTADDTVWASLYAINFHLAAEGADYFAADIPDSPLLHIWSLAVEEQFYLVWPLILVLTVRLSGGVRTWPLLSATVALTAVSLIASWLVTPELPAHAYYLPVTRMFELGIGAIVALIPPGVEQVPRPLRSALSWVGLAAIIYAGTTFDAYTEFPGLAALVPTLATAVVIVTARPGVGAGRVLSTRALMPIGRSSYSLYLWHWPLLVLLGTAGTGRQDPLTGAGIVTLAAVLAWGTFRLVEDPVRRSRFIAARRRRGLLLVAGLMGIPIVVAMTCQWFAGPVRGDVDAFVPRISPIGDPTLQLQTLVERSTALHTLPGNITPSLESPRSDTTAIFRDGCHRRTSSTATTTAECVYGSKSSGTTAFLFGDSTAAHWFPSLELVATRNRWRIVAHTRGACSGFDLRASSHTETCDKWRRATLAVIAREKPTVLVLASRMTCAERCAPAMQRTVQAIRQSSPKTTIVLFKDTPLFEKDLPYCLAARMESIQECGLSRAAAASQIPGDMQAAAKKAGARWVDTHAWICGGSRCPPVIGNHLLLMDRSHLTIPTAELLAPLLEHELEAAVRG